METSMLSGERCPTPIPLDASADALAGYPLQSLLELAEDRCTFAEEHGQRLVMQTLQSWISSLDQELTDFPPADTEVLAQIKQRVKCSRDALERVVYTLNDGGRATIPVSSSTRS